MGVKLNASKSKLLVVSRKCNPPNLTLSINNSPLQQVSTVSYLGVHFTSDLSWDNHIDTVCSKAKKQLEIMHKHFHLADLRVLLQLYKSLVLPILHYCLPLWDPHYGIHSKQLDSIQTFAARVISKSWRGSSSNLVSSLHLPSLSVRRKKHKVALSYCIINTNPFILHTSPIIPSQAQSSSTFILFSYSLYFSFIFLFS